MKNKPPARSGSASAGPPPRPRRAPVTLWRQPCVAHRQPRGGRRGAGEKGEAQLARSGLRGTKEGGKGTSPPTLLRPAPAAPRRRRWRAGGGERRSTEERPSDRRSPGRNPGPQGAFEVSMINVSCNSH